LSSFNLFKRNSPDSHQPVRPDRQNGEIRGSSSQLPLHPLIQLGSRVLAPLPSQTRPQIWRWHCTGVCEIERRSRSPSAGRCLNSFHQLCHPKGGLLSQPPRCAGDCVPSEAGCQASRQPPSSHQINTPKHKKTQQKNTNPTVVTMATRKTTASVARIPNNQSINQSLSGGRSPRKKPNIKG